ncbi:MAG: glycine--tRNA ligase subunit beta [Rhodobacter sp.]|nr:glycine--tRNA ligase subunit beta [Rhodobacter sp.]MCA3513396.1 glycine--tRNA ligase subunit beta [Rhodobacter sp.]MCA3520129.1 glycine--tRNA ligase subunit beta [Rhodobacter sp.]MCA3521790.1 glycine--tRNA ligase subunit beta [Rhodobacter sp.]MCA3527249.1 glycine--tRNA ligase subunit beta [Rhodobacter sp.]
MPDLLLELFSEEIPARMQARAREDLRRLVTDGLVEAGLTYAGAGAFSTPRRLVLTVQGLTGESRAVREERKGPAMGAPSAALEGFLKAFGVDHPTAKEALDSLALSGPGRAFELNGVKFENRDVKGKQFYFASWEKPGRLAAAIVAEVVESTIRSFPWPKSMRWGSGTLRWVRPLHSILCLLTDEGGAEVVPLEVDGIAAGNTTAGHRFMAPARFAVSSFDDCRARLHRAFVLLDPAEREAQIWHDATTAAFAQGLEVVPDPALLAEVAGLVEWPVVLMGSISADFLGLPPEVLQTSMKEHQKFFSVRNPGTGRIEKFVTVANRETADHGATILAGNQKVLAARLSDAKFFWENDLRVVHDVGLEGMAAGLADVTFHNRLGSQADRVARIEALSRDIAPLVGASPDLAAEAARVAKADLQSAMVGEFPELQGTMGGYYARAAGLPEAVAAACKAHYSPLGPSDEVPTDPVSVAVALADKIDTLTGFWAIDEKPTGSKDPFALRRAALGVIRLVLGNRVTVKLETVLHDPMDRCLVAARSHTIDDIKDFDSIDDVDSIGMSSTKSCPELVLDLLSFLHDRLKVYLRDQGIRHDVIDACLAMPGNDDLTLLVKRAEALSAVLKTEDGANLLAGFRRANNILTQAEEKDGVEYSYGADPKFAETGAERALFTALDQAEATITPALQSEDFATAMAAMAALRAPIDAFFTDVQVNSDNPVLRRNRLNLLHRIRSVCGQVADLARIEG